MQQGGKSLEQYQKKKEKRKKKKKERKKKEKSVPLNRKKSCLATEGQYQKEKLSC